MKNTKAISLLALTGLALATIPAPMAIAQTAAAATVRIAASRGQAEYLNGDGRWVRLKGPMQAAEGTAVRTAVGAELTATFSDGSTLRIGETSAMRFTRLAAVSGHAEVGVRLMGQMDATLSPATVANDVMTVDMPVARATINKAFAEARAVRNDVASSVATIHLQTPTARAVRLAVTQGAATLHALYNVTGVILAVDPEHHAFTLVDNATGRARRVIVGNATLLAQRDENSARAVRSPQQVVAGLSPRTSVIVYGDPTSAEGPGDDALNVNAQVIFPEGCDYLAAEQYVNQNLAVFVPPTAGSPGTGTAMGDGVPVTAGNTAIIGAGEGLPTLSAGIHLVDVISQETAPSIGGAAGSVLPVVAGVGVVTAIAIVINGNNVGHVNQVETSQATTGTVQVTVNRLRRGRASLARAGSESPAQATAPLGSSILAGTEFIGAANGPMLTTSASVETPAVVGLIPLNHRMQLHLGATSTAGTTYSSLVELDLGVDYLINPTHAIGIGVENRNYSLVDPIGNASNLSTTVPSLRYSIRY